MIFRRTSSTPKEGVVLPRLLNCFSRCFQALRWCSQACHRRFQVLPGMLSGLPGAPRLVVGAPRLVTGAPRCSLVHLKATTSVQSTLGFEHPGILVRHLPNTPRGSLWQQYIVRLYQASYGSLVMFKRAMWGSVIGVQWESNCTVSWLCDTEFWEGKVFVYLKKSLVPISSSSSLYVISSFWSTLVLYQFTTSLVLSLHFPHLYEVVGYILLIIPNFSGEFLPPAGVVINFHIWRLLHS